MKKVTNPLDIYTHLPKTNCAECGTSTCLSFANLVVQGKADIRECPRISPEAAYMFEGNIGERLSIEREQEKEMARLKAEIAASDLEALASRVGLNMMAGRISVESLGRKFFIDESGNVASECHAAIPWLAIPMLAYILKGGKSGLSGDWVDISELEGGPKWSRLFGRRCELEMKELADRYPDFFGDLTSIFSGGMDRSFMDADVSLVLYPLPRLPILICYWREEDGFESKLRVYFDKTATDNLDIAAIYTLGVGLVIMFGRIAQRHGI